MAALCHRLCIVFIFTFSQLCVSEPLIKFSYQRPSVQAGTPSQAPQPQAQQYPFMTALARVRAKLMALVQKKLAELQILAASFAPSPGNLTTTPQLAPGQQVSPLNIPGLSQLAGSLQNILPALQSAALNPPILPPAQTALGQQVPGVPTAPVQPLPVQPGGSQPVATPGVQPLVQTPVQAPVQTPVQAPVQTPVPAPVQTPISPQVQVQPQQAVNPLPSSTPVQ